MSLIEKLLEIRKSIKPLVKDAHNEHQNFNYVSSVKVLEAVRDKMNDLGVLLIPEIEMVEIQTHGKQILTQVWFTMTWLDAESNEKLNSKWYAQGLDVGEKGVGKAQTYAEKTYILKFFNIPTPQDDVDAGNAKLETPVSKQRTSAPTQSKEPKRPNGMITEIQIKQINNLIENSDLDAAMAKRYLYEQHKMIQLTEGLPDLETLSSHDAQVILDNSDAFVSSCREWIAFNQNQDAA